MFRGQLNPWGQRWWLAMDDKGTGLLLFGTALKAQGEARAQGANLLSGLPTPSPQQRAMMLSSLLREKDELRERIAQQELKIPVVTIGCAASAGRHDA